jgi:hypothetical protein
MATNILCAFIAKRCVKKFKEWSKSFATMHAIQECKFSSSKSRSPHWSNGFGIVQHCSSNYNLIKIDIVITRANVPPSFIVVFIESFPTICRTPPACKEIG